MLMRSLLVGVVLASSAWIVHGNAPEPMPSAALSALPTQLGYWTGYDEPSFDEETLRVLGVDTYVNRSYVPASPAGPGPVGLYIGYYGSQRQGDAIHSPLNCLPGTGWQPIERARVEVPAAGASAPFEANRLLVQKGRDRQLVVYWYEGRGRRVASEYWNKALLIADAVRINRTDGSLVRLMTPVLDSRQASEQRILDFATLLVPELDRTLPGSGQERAE
jgi:EpsI family protein